MKNILIIMFILVNCSLFAERIEYDTKVNLEELRNEIYSEIPELNKEVPIPGAPENLPIKDKFLKMEVYKGKLVIIDLPEQYTKDVEKIINKHDPDKKDKDFDRIFSNFTQEQRDYIKKMGAK